jgi:hypothetical protein
MTPEQLQKLNEEKMCEGYFKKYGEHMNAFGSSLVGKAMNLQEHHFIQLGKQLDQWNTYKQIMEANGSLNTLGELPKIALDVITAVMSNSVLPVIASTQAIEEQKQLVYFKNLYAEDTKGNRTAGQKIVDPRTGNVTGSGYASNKIPAEQIVTTVNLQVAYSGTLAAVPVYRESLKLTFSGSSSIFAEDVGPRGSDPNIGTLLGAGLSGTINYTTGAYSITFAANPGAGAFVYAEYQQNLELATDIPRVSTFMDSVMVESKAYALKAVYGMFEQFVMKKRFGDGSALHDLSMELVNEINAEVAGDVISQYSAQAVGTTTFSLTLPSGVSEKEHRESYAFRMADAEAVMLGNAGRGTIKVMIVGREHAALVRGLSGFNLLSDGGSLGSHIFGTYKGITYVRVPETALLAAKNGIALYTGASPFESAGVYCPFMPITMSEEKSHGLNPLQSQKVAAHLAATKVVVPQYATKLNLVP